jgi:glycerophosphoryl diester phosphodiesterase
MKNYLRIAHRGASADYPENTLAAFQAAIDMKCEGIELDVHLSKESAPVVVHDAQINGQRIVDMTLPELAEYDIPHLREVTELDRGTSILMVELKRGDSPVDQLISNTLDLMQHDPGNWLIGSLDFEIVDKLRGATSRLIGIAENERAIDQFLQWKIPTLAIDRLLASETVIHALKSERRECWVWTVDDPEESKKLVALGVNGIITNNPRSLM